MKKFYLFAVLFLSVCVSHGQDVVSNGDFESWGPNPLYDEPDDWTTLNPLAQIFGAELAFKTSDPSEVNSGTHAIKLVTTNLTGVGVTPSILTNGMVNTSTQNVEGGTEINSRPLALDFAYRFDPQGADSAIASITLTKWDATNGTQLVGAAETKLVSTSGQWESYQLEVDYALQETPDTVLILFTTGSDVDPQAGTALYVDDVAYAYSLASVEDASALSMVVYPNPTADLIYIRSNSSFQVESINVYSMQGGLVVSVSNTDRVDMKGMEAGNYIVELITADGKRAQQRIFKK